MVSFFLACFLPLLAYWIQLPGSHATTDNNPVVYVRNGSLVGAHSDHYNQDMFLNIPYATAPLGNLRFKGPVPYNQTYQNRDSTSYGNACFGTNTVSIIAQAYNSVSEDCLTLNIVRPTGQTKVPVVIWIHGGGFQFGSGIDKRYNTSFLVQESVQAGEPIIGITMNYRLGPWGFLASKEIVDEGAANAGLRDQRMAMKWVRENIASFGGDPDKITIMGESSGATSVGYHLLAYSGNNNGLFRQAILESGSVFNPTQIVGLEFYQPIYNLLIRQTNCTKSTCSSSLECLRNLPPVALEAILQASPFNAVFNPLVDGDFLPYYPSDALSRGAFAHIPIIIGTNTDEGTLFTVVFAPTGVHNDSEFNQLLNRTGSLTRAQMQTLTILYPNVPALGSPYNSGNDSAAFPVTLGAQFKRAASYVGDFMFIANKRRTAEAWAAANLTAYSYRFNTVATSPLPSLSFGVWHTTEIAFVFHDLGDPAFVNQTESVIAVSDSLSRRWIGFIAQSDPNSILTPDQISWPKYSESASNIVFQPNKTHTEKDDFRSEQLAFINSIPSSYMR